MDIHTKDFFRPINLTSEPSEEQYKTIQIYIRMVEKFSASTYQSLYIIDYYRRSFVYVSDNPIFLCGLKPSVVQKMGYSFYLKYVPQNDLEMLLEINKAGFEFYEDIPINERLDYSISYDFNLEAPNRNPVLINHKLIPLLLDKDSNIWLALCAVSISSNREPGNVFIRKKRSSQMFQYDFENSNWIKQPILKISNTEKEILLYSSQGYTVDDIAKKIYVTPSTIKFHRQNIYHKMNVKNISEAIAFAINYNLL